MPAGDALPQGGDRLARGQGPAPAAQTELRSGRVQLQPPASRPGSRPLEVLAPQRGRSPPGDIRSYVVRLARTVGFIPSKRRPLPGNEILWRAWLDLQRSVRMLQAAAENPEGLQAAFGGGR